MLAVSSVLVLLLSAASSVFSVVVSLPLAVSSTLAVPLISSAVLFVVDFVVHAVHVHSVVRWWLLSASESELKEVSLIIRSFT